MPRKPDGPARRARSCGSLRGRLSEHVRGPGVPREDSFGGAGVRFGSMLVAIPEARGLLLRGGRPDRPGPSASPLFPGMVRGLPEAGRDHRSPRLAGAPGRARAIPSPAPLRSSPSCRRCSGRASFRRCLQRDLARGDAHLTLGIARRLRSAARRIRHGSPPWAVILLYHRVGEGAQDPWGLAVTRARFAEQMEVLRHAAQPVPMGRLLAALDHARPARTLVAVTFDDGYAESLRTARPILERLGIPATAFLTSGYIGSGREFWWDALERALFEPRQLPETLVLRTSRAHREWTFANAVPGAPRHRRAFASLYSWLRPLPDSERRALVDELCGWAGVPAMPRPGRRPLSEDDVRQFAAGELVEG